MNNKTKTNQNNNNNGGRDEFGGADWSEEELAQFDRENDEELDN